VAEDDHEAPTFAALDQLTSLGSGGVLGRKLTTRMLHVLVYPTLCHSDPSIADQSP
jgi:hypothetical protein